MYTSKSVLDVKNIYKSFPGVQALADVSFVTYSHEVLGIVGENGAGKSTLMKILSGVHTMDSGQILIDGQEVTIRNPIEALDLGIAIIHQELSLIQQLTVVENMFIGKWESSKLGLIDWKKMKIAVKKIFSEFHIDIPVDSRVDELSTAQCQLIEIVRAVSSGAKIIIMDEPTSSLASNEVDLLFEMIKDLQNRGITIIYITHRLEELFHICSRIYVLKDGRNSGEFNIEHVTTDEIINAMIGRDLSTFYPTRSDYHTSEEVVLEVQDLCLDTRVHNVNFKAYKGEILGFSGLVGSGRTEIMRSIFKAEPFSSGKIILFGKHIKIKDPEDAINAGIVYASEDRKREGLVLTSPVSHNITLADLDGISNHAGILDLKKEVKISENYVNKLKIRTESVEKIVKDLSGGNQQKIVLAKWLNTDAEVFIFDEPTKGIDVAAKSEIYELMVNLADAGKAVIFVSSEMPEILGVSDRILVICEGRISGEFYRTEATEDLLMKAAIGGNSI